MSSLKTHQFLSPKTYPSLSLESYQSMSSKFKTWNLTNPYLGNFHPEKLWQETLYKPVPCSILCCFSHQQWQPPSSVFPYISLLWGLLCSVTLWYSLAPNSQGTFLFSSDTCIGETHSLRTVTQFLTSRPYLPIYPPFCSNLLCQYQSLHAQISSQKYQQYERSFTKPASPVELPRWTPGQRI